MHPLCCSLVRQSPSLLVTLVYFLKRVFIFARIPAGQARTYPSTIPKLSSRSFALAVWPYPYVWQAFEETVLSGSGPRGDSSCCFWRPYLEARRVLAGDYDASCNNGSGSAAGASVKGSDFLSTASSTVCHNIWITFGVLFRKRHRWRCVCFVVCVVRDSQWSVSEARCRVLLNLTGLAEQLSRFSQSCPRFS